LRGLAQEVCQASKVLGVPLREIELAGTGALPGGDEAGTFGGESVSIDGVWTLGGIEIFSLFEIAADPGAREIEMMARELGDVIKV
jgi:hypothetical protein